MSISSTNLDFDSQCDYTNFVCLLAKLDETVESYEVILRRLALEVDSFSIFNRSVLISPRKQKLKKMV